jgi:hypothetical protein
MKILKVLKEQEDNNNLDVIDGGTFGFMKDSMDVVEKELEGNTWKFSTETFNSPDGTYKCNTTLYVKRSSDTEMNLSGKIYLMLKEDRIPTDYLIVCTEWIMSRLELVCPELFEMVKDQRYQPHSITFNYKDTFVGYKDTFLSLYDFIDRAYYNNHMGNLHPIEELMDYNSIQSKYTIDESQVPKFSDDYSLATDRMTKKVKSVFLGFKKGTFKGHEYEYKEKNPRISIHIRNTTYDQTTKVIHPNFNVSINAGYVWIDGKTTSEMSLEKDMFTDKEFTKEFNDYIKKRFAQFGIKIM